MWVRQEHDTESTNIIKWSVCKLISYMLWREIYNIHEIISITLIVLKY